MLFVCSTTSPSASIPAARFEVPFLSILQLPLQGEIASAEEEQTNNKRTSRSECEAPPLPHQWSHVVSEEDSLRSFLLHAVLLLRSFLLHAVRPLAQPRALTKEAQDASGGSRLETAKINPEAANVFHPEGCALIP